MDSIRKFVAPEFIFGSGSLSLTAQYAEHLGATKILLVSDPVVRRTPWYTRVESQLKDRDLDYVVF